MNKNLARWTKTWNRRVFSFLKVYCFYLGAFWALILLLASILLLPFWQVRSLPPSLERVQAETAARDVVVKAIGGSLVFVTAFVGIRNLRVAEEKQLAERFSKAVEMLGHKESSHIRLGGIYALERIAIDSKKDRYPVMQVLSAFVRTTAQAKNDDDSDRRTNELHPYEIFSSDIDFHEQKQEERYGSHEDYEDITLVTTNTL